MRLMKEKWGDVLSSDPSYNPNLSLTVVNALASPPSAAYPWSQRRSRRSIRNLILRS